MAPRHDLDALAKSLGIDLDAVRRSALRQLRASAPSTLPSQAPTPPAAPIVKAAMEIRAVAAEPVRLPEPVPEASTSKVKARKARTGKKVSKPVEQRAPKKVTLVTVPEEVKRPAAPSPASQPPGQIQPTAEQVAIVEAARRLRAAGRGSMRVIAYAGAGKTSTLRLVASDAMSGMKGLYIAFNKDIAQDARASFPSFVDPRTMHSVARRAISVPGGDLPNINAHLVVQIVGDGAKDWLPTTEVRVLSQARWVAAALKEFCQSADREPGEAHIARALDAAVYRLPHTPPQDKGERKRHEEMVARRAAAREVIERHLMACWNMLANWRRTDMRPPHDVYLKLFELDDDLVAATMADYGYVLLDEAQDVNPVMRSICVKSSRIIIAVGDPWQQIYSWRGAEDALSLLPGEQLYLTQSFRFGQSIADEAWSILVAKPEAAPTRPLRGNERKQSRIEHDETGRLPIRGSAVVCRTNAGVLRAAVAAAGQGLKVHVAGGVDELSKELESAVALFENRLNDIKVDSLKRFTAWADLKLEAEDLDDPALKRLVDAVETGSLVRDLALVKRFHVTERNADVICSTCHRAKGREWDTVILWSDWPGITKLRARYRKAVEAAEADGGQDGVKQALEEWHVYYVAVTRAIKRLIIASDPNEY